jgi:hypothetical protein
MENYSLIIFLVIALIISLLIYKKDFKNWYDLDNKDKYYALRAPLIIVFCIILWIWKILNK